MSAIIEFLKARAMEKTTWAGLTVLILGVVGIEATSVQAETMAGAITALIGVIMGLIPERK